MKIESLKSDSYTKAEHTLRVLVRARSKQEVIDNIVGKDRLTVCTDNEERQVVVATFDGFKFAHSITPYDGGFEVILGDEPPTLDFCIAQKIKEIEAYDTSPAVNSFSLAGVEMWLDKDTRVGLMNSIGIEKSAGRTLTNLWFRTTKYTLPVDLVVKILNEIELYALASYNVTHLHIAAVEKLTSRDEVEKYDYTNLYPTKLTFNL